MIGLWITAGIVLVIFYYVAVFWLCTKVIDELCGPWVGFTCWMIAAVAIPTGVLAGIVSAGS